MTRTCMAAMIALALAPAVAAQTPQAANRLTDARWAAFIGCWEQADRADTPRTIRQCVVPTTDGRGVRMLTFADDRQIFEDTIVADGTPQPYAEEGCRGERRARWSNDADRIYSESELHCDGKPDIRTAGITTMISDDEWLDVQVMPDEHNARARVRHYLRGAGEWPSPLADLATTLVTPVAPRLGAVSLDDVVEAYDATGTVAVQAWLLESNTKLPVDRKSLIWLADRHVAEPVLDLLVAQTYPSRFEVRRPSTQASYGNWMYGDPALANRRGRFIDPDALFFAPFSPFFPYGDSYWLYSGYIPVIAEPSAPAPAAHGQVINGRGYTQVTPREPVATSRSNGGGDASSSSNGSGGGGGSSSSGGGSIASPSGYSGGGSTGITAVPR